MMNNAANARTKTMIVSLLQLIGKSDYTVFQKKVHP